MRIPNEPVVLNRAIPETAAGKELRYTPEQLLEMQKEGVNFEKVAPLSESIEKQIKKDRKMTNLKNLNLPVMILFSFLSLHLQYFGPLIRPRAREKIALH